jgi:hypothetical protein
VSEARRIEICEVNRELFLPLYHGFWTMSVILCTGKVPPSPSFPEGSTVYKGTHLQDGVLLQKLY